jgi:hypothetical protein
MRSRRRSRGWLLVALTGIALLVVAVASTTVGWLSHRRVDVAGIPEIASPAGPPKQPEGDGWTVAPGSTERVGSGTLYRYRVEVEGATGLDATAVAQVVDYALDYPQGWTREPVAFQRVDSGDVNMVVRVAMPDTVDRMCAPMETNGEVSCRNGDDVVLNAARWKDGVTAYAGDLDRYRIVLVNHEVGHRIGHHGHPPCPGQGQPAPVMMQLYYTGLQGCVANIWPYAQDGTFIG